MATLADSKLDRFRGLFYGPPGSWKTVFAHAFPKTRTLDFDDGMASVLWAIKTGIIQKDPSEVVFETILEGGRGKYGQVVKASALDVACDVLDGWLKDDSWETLVIDSGSSLSDCALNKGLEENARLSLSKSREQSKLAGFRVMRMQDWGAGASLFQQFIDWCRSLDRNLILVCHEYQLTDEEGAVIQIEPLLIGQLRQRIGKDFGEVWHFALEGSRQDRKARIQTVSGGRCVAKSRLGCLDPVESADFAAIRRKVATFYGVEEERLWVRS